MTPYQLALLYILLHLLLGGFQRLVVTPNAVEAGVVLPAWIVLVAVLAFLRDDDPGEAGVLMAVLTAAAMLFTLLLRTLVSPFSQPEQSALLFAIFALPIAVGVAAGVNAVIVVAVVRSLQRIVRTRRKSRDAPSL